MDTCTICSEIIGNGDVFLNKYYSDIVVKRESIIYSTKHFVVVPSLGALNRSHILIAPREHYLSFSTLPKEWDDELTKLKKLLTFYSISNTGVGLIFFEHGTGASCNNSGSCVEHAHIHGIWNIEYFGKELRNNIKMTKLQHIGELHQKANKMNGYIYFEDIWQSSWLANNPEIPSQYFRYLYSKIASLGIDWDWRSDPLINNIRNVFNFYKDI